MLHSEMKLDIAVCLTTKFNVYPSYFVVTLQNQGHTTSINIRVHQINTPVDYPSDDAKEHMAHISEGLQDQSASTAGEAKENYTEETDGAVSDEQLDNYGYPSNEHSTNSTEDFQNNFDDENGDMDGHVMEKMNHKVFFYDHPVLRRIEGKPVFYISAIAEENVPSNILTAPNGSVFHEEKTGDNVNHDTENEKGNNHYGNSTIKSRTFLQPLEYYSNSQRHGIITLNGWEGYQFAKARYYCCYRYDNNVTSVAVRERNNHKVDKRKRKTKHAEKHTNQENNSIGIKSSPMLWKNIWNMHIFKIIKAAQFVCPLIPMESGGTVTMGSDANKNKFPTKVALSDKENCKNEKILKYIDIERQPPRRKDSIAVCPKLVYGNYSADRLIEWFEFNKLMGVDKIMLFTYNIVDDIKVVLDHYVKEGLLITREFDIPAKMSFSRKPGGKNMLAFQDEQVTVFDCIERFNGFRFVAVLDLDEFLVPADAVNADVTWRTMLNQLQNTNPNASGFVFHTQIFTLDWGISNPRGKLFVTKHIKRTSTMWDRRKNVIIPERVGRGMVWTHAYTSASGYIPVKVQSKIANIFHYRNCRRHWIKSNTCMKRRLKHMDKTMVLVMNRIEKQILEMKSKLLKS
ncbi:uncharacterized protein LOC123527009 [Mercenaria mercenaria]|uniref:uncharacterized protein LOC123527009 n=1 Tax=Mercenaria mercenaria TaxID=6596 RepID=UPI00234E424B|nr:uncharacterized protein LOC123527009 [Mercenaria mercenaria]